jgi:hypothetical protein
MSILPPRDRIWLYCNCCQRTFDAGPLCEDMASNLDTIYAARCGTTWEMTGSVCGADFHDFYIATDRQVAFAQARPGKIDTEKWWEAA